MKNIAAFLNYVIDFRKVKLIALVICLFGLSLLVGCRAQQHIDAERYEIEKAELLAAHAAELESAVTRFYAESEARDTTHRAEAEEIAKVLYGTARYHDRYNQELVVWCIINRVEHNNYPDTIKDVCQQESQWMGYSENNPILSEHFEIAETELERYYSGDYRPMGPEYIYMSWTEDEIVLRDRFEENGRTHYWRA